MMLLNGRLFHFTNCLHKFARFSNTTSLHTFTKCGDFSRMIKMMGSRLSPAQMEHILTSGEHNLTIKEILGPATACPVKKIYVNQLAANVFLEDRWNIGFNQIDGEVTSLLFGVFDGHSGTSCVDTVNRAALEYVAAALLDRHKLVRVLNSLSSKEVGKLYTICRRLVVDHLVTNDNENVDVVQTNLIQYVNQLLDDNNRNMDPVNCLKHALLQLDEDICTSALPSRQVNPDSSRSRLLFKSAMSGTVGLLGRIFWKRNPRQPWTLHLANVGDCSAVLARKKDNKMTCIPLSTSHTAFNQAERQRLCSEHPENTEEQLLHDNRLLGELAPLRSFGDVRYKWPAEELIAASKHIAAPGGYDPTPDTYTSPPYLTAEPDVTEHTLTADDHYMILASDGLWDTMTGDEAVRLLSTCPPNLSPATHLLRHALGSKKEGSDIVDNKRLSIMLSLTQGTARYFRDDITIVVMKLPAATIDDTKESLVVGR